MHIKDTDNLKPGTVACETHVHTHPASPCAQETPQTVAKAYRDAGYGALALTNHYMKWLFEDYFPKDTDPVERFISFYDDMKEAGERLGLRVFFGMELDLAKQDGLVTELLCYGITKDFLRAHRNLYDMPQREFFRLAADNGIAVFQSHPFRNYCRRAHPQYMHGVEVYNGHHSHDGHNDAAAAFAAEHGLIGISGSDFHEAVAPDGTSTVRGGIIMPDSVRTDAQFAACLLSGAFTLIKNGAL